MTTNPKELRRIKTKKIIEQVQIMLGGREVEVTLIELEDYTGKSFQKVHTRLIDKERLSRERYKARKLGENNETN